MTDNVPPLDQIDVTSLQQFIVDAYAKIESEHIFFEEKEGSPEGR